VNRVEVALRDIATALENMRAAFAVVGGLAVSVRAEPRFTRDVDLAISVATDAEAEQLIHDLAPVGYAVLATVEQDAKARLSTVRLKDPRQGGIVVDLLFASSGIEPEVVSAAQPLEVVPGLSLPIATVGHLIALKLLSEAPQRPQDASDLVALFQIASATDLEQARAAIDLISVRGFNRGRDLGEALRTFVARPTNR
jgi:Nucleotidyl transferase AbiEii toxin, Type IV TA system